MRESLWRVSCIFEALAKQKKMLLAKEVQSFRAVFNSFWEGSRMKKPEVSYLVSKSEKNMYFNMLQYYALSKFSEVRIMHYYLVIPM